MSSIFHLIIWIAVLPTLATFSAIQQKPKNTLSLRMYPSSKNMHGQPGEPSWAYDDNGEYRPGYPNIDHKWHWSDQPGTTTHYDIPGGLIPRPNYPYGSRLGSQQQSHGGGEGGSTDFFQQFTDYESYARYGQSPPSYNSPYQPLRPPKGTSYQQAMPQQTANRHISEIIYKSPSGRTYIVDITDLPSGTTYDPSRETSFKGVPVLVGPKQKQLYFSRHGNIVDKGNHKHDNQGNRLNADGSFWVHSRYKTDHLKRDDLINKITTPVKVSTHNVTAPTLQQSQFQKYFNTYRILQTKIDSLVFPFIQTMINTTNDILIYDVAMTAYVEIVGLPIKLNGPFQGGMNATTWLEKQYFNGTNHSIASIIATPNSRRTKDDIVALKYFSSYQSLLNVYYNAYYNGMKTANSTNLLNTFWTLQNYLITNDTSIMSKEYTTVNTQYVKKIFSYYTSNKYRLTYMP